MNRSDSTKALSAALCKAQTKMKPVKRNARNEADGYAYAVEGDEPFKSPNPSEARK